MTKPPDVNVHDTPRSDQLNGWKEIAAFFGKAPRTVQRWEMKLGLPVRRLSTPPGEIVFALRSELEAWRDMQSGRQLADESAWDDGVDEAATTGTTPGAPAAEAAAARALPVTALPPRVVRSIVAAVALLAAAGLVAAWIVTRPGTVATAVFSGNAVVARDLSGREAWRHAFGTPLWAHPDPAAVRAVHEARLAPGADRLVVDVNRDGQPEVLALATYGDPASVGYQQELICFSSSGDVMWSYRPRLELAFAEERFDSNWVFLDVLVADPPARPGVWVSVASSPYWGAAVVRIDVSGGAELRFVNAGAIYGLGQITTPSGWRLLAGGVNNEYETAAFAVLDEREPAASSPQCADCRYRCTNGPAGSPVAYVLLPRSDINVAEAVKPYNHVARFLPGGSGVDVVTVESLKHSSFGFYRLLPALGFERLVMSDSTAHRVLEAEGKLDHAERDCPLTAKGAVVRQWTRDGGWQDAVVRVTPR